MATTSTDRASEQYPFRRARHFRKLPPAIEHATVGDAAQSPLLICDAGAPLRSVARSMAANRVHSVVVRDAPRGFDGWSVITEATLIAALGEGRMDATAGEVASAPAVTADQSKPLLEAAQLMHDAGATHLLVFDVESRRPVGILSGLDLAATWVWGIG